MPIAGEPMNGDAGFKGITFGIKTPPASRLRSGWAAGRRVASPSKMFGPYIDLLEDQDFSIAKDPKADQKMWRDCQIRSSIRLRQFATASRKIEFSPREDSIGGTAAAEFAAREWARVRRPTEVLLNILDAVPRGVSFQECVWKNDPTTLSWFAEDILPVNKNRFVFSLDGELCLRTPYDVFYGETVPPRVFMHHRYDPEPADWGNPESEGRLYFGQGEMDRIWPWFLWKQLVMRLGFTYLDRLAFPIKIGKYPYRSKETRDELLAMLQDLDHHRVGAWPGDEGWDVDFLQTTATGHNTAMEWITYIDNQIAKNILGSILLQEPGERGSFALGVNHSTTVFGTICEFDSISLCDTIENTWVKWLFEMNGLPTQLAPRVLQATGKTQDLGQLIDTMMLLSDKGYPISVEQIAEQTGIRPARPGETTLSMGPDLDPQNVEIEHGEESPFEGEDDPNNFPDKGDRSVGGGKKKTRVSIPFGSKSPYALNLDILPEHSVSEADVLKHAMLPGTRIYKSATGKTVQRKLGPRKAKTLARFAKENSRVKFEYTNLKKEYKTYDIEPYSYRYRRGFLYLYGFDPSDRTIKSFFAHKITNIRRSRHFFPRWVIELTD